jgi:hypothetical protein
MKVFFKTLLHNVELMDENNEKYDAEIKFNFAGFKKFKSSCSGNGANSWSFDYSTIYPHNLNLKILTIKCYRRNLLGYKRLIAENQVSLFMLATGPSKYKIMLKNKLTLSFTCEFTQLCKNFKCIFDSDSKADFTLLDNGKYIPIIDFTLELSKSVAELEKLMIVLSTSSFPLLSGYSPKDMDKFVPLGTLGTLGPLGPLVPLGIRRCISHGPLYHQMSESSIATEDGVIQGELMTNYPTPLKWSKKSVIGLMNTLGGALSAPGERSIPWGTMETLIHLYFNKLIMETNELTNLPNLPNLPNLANLNLKKRLNNALIRAKMQYHVDIDVDTESGTDLLTI